jgi:hypothetical protein
MNAKDIRQIEGAFQTALALKANTIGVEGAIKLQSSVFDRNGDPFVFYAYRRAAAKKLYLTDGGTILKTLQKAGMEVQMKLLQSLMRSYGLIITQDGCVVDESDRVLWKRVLALFQAWSAADGVLRTWARQD